MSKGRRDYTWGVLQDSIKPGQFTSNWFRENYYNIEGDIYYPMISYTVPAGYKLFLLGIIVSAKYPGIKFLNCNVDTFSVCYIYFDTNYTIDFGAFGSFVIEEDKDLEIGIYNYDTIQTWCSVVTIGLLEELV